MSDTAAGASDAAGSDAQEPGQEQVEQEQAQQQGPARPRSLDEAMANMPEQQLRQLRLAKLAGAHGGLWLVTLGLFAAADSWQLLSGLSVAAVLAVVTGTLAGFTTATVIHEWFHLLGARNARGVYTIPKKIGLFVYDWDFARNDTQQFLTMSIAGSVGSITAVLLVWLLLPTDTLGRAAVLGGVVAGLVFAAVIEWPVLRRVRAGGDPLTELGSIDGEVLRRSLFAALAAAAAIVLFGAP